MKLSTSTRIVLSEEQLRLMELNRIDQETRLEESRRRWMKIDREEQQRYYELTRPKAWHYVPESRRRRTNSILDDPFVHKCIRRGFYMVIFMNIF